jgi:ABC-type phosphate transport system substrate-binding protein
MRNALVFVLVVLMLLQAVPARTQDDSLIPIISSDRLSDILADRYLEEHARENGILFEVQRSPGTIDMLCNGEAAIIATVHPLDPGDCDQFIEIVVGIGGAAIIASDGVDFMSCLNEEEIAAVFSAAGDQNATRWNDVNENFPDRIVTVYVPRSNPIQRYFESEVLTDVGPREGVLNLGTDPVRNINARQSAIGYIAIEDYLASPMTFNGIPVNNGEECVLPDERLIVNNRYLTASPMYWYVSLNDTFDQALISNLMGYVLSEGGREIASRNNIWTPPLDITMLSLSNFAEKRTGFFFTQQEPLFEIKLSWTGAHDLDLRVLLPEGDEIGFFNLAGSGAHLITDNGNEYCSGQATAPAEIFESAPDAPTGTDYVVAVQYSFNCNEPVSETEYTVEVIMNGEVIETLDGVVSEESNVVVETVSLP